MSCNSTMRDHPETKPGEIFLTNASTATFYTIGWSSKRKGIVAYSIHGIPLAYRDLFPVFVSKEELRRNGIDIPADNKDYLPIWSKGEHLK